MSVFYKLFKINELLYGTSGTGDIGPLAETASVPVKCKKNGTQLLLISSSTKWQWQGHW